MSYQIQHEDVEDAINRLRKKMVQGIYRERGSFDGYVKEINCDYLQKFFEYIFTD